MSNDTISEPQGYKKPVMSVGEEFIAWAETYWKIDNLYDNACSNPSEKNIELCPYSVVKPIFIEKINQIIEQRIKDYL